MLSVHPRAFSPTSKYGYKTDWAIPGSILPDERGPYAALRIDTFHPQNVARLAREHCISPIIWQKGTRLAENFISALWVALDFDDGTYTLEQARGDWARFAHVIGTTKSHQVEKDGKPPCDRFRVLVRADTVCTDAAIYRATITALIEEFGADKTCKDAARFFYPCTSIVSFGDVDGYTLEWSSDEPEKPPDKPQRVHEPIKIEERKRLLSWTHKTRHFLEFGAYAHGTRHDTIKDVIPNFIRNGMSDEQILDVISSRTDKPIDEIKSLISWWRDKAL